MRTINRPNQVFPGLSIATICFAIATSVSQYGGQPVATAADNDKSDRLLRHVVMFKFKDSSSDEDVRKVVAAFGELKSKISAIHGYEYGINNSPENLNDGFTHCFLVTFKSEEDRAVYLPHADHLAFVSVLKPHLDKVMVIDYWSEN